MIGIVALILGIISVISSIFSNYFALFIIAGIGGLTTIVLSIIGLVKKKDKILSIIGLVLGIISIIIIVLFIASSVKNVVDQRQLLVGSENPSDSLTKNSFDLVSILSGANVTTNLFENMEILIRSNPGAAEINILSVTIEITSQTNNQIVSFEETSERCDLEIVSTGKYCVVHMSGNEDNILGAGERFKILFNLDETISTEETLTIRFYFEGNLLSETSVKTPDIITTTKAKLWPLG